MQVRLLDLTAQYAAIREELRRAIDQVCDTQSFILGPAVESFEQDLARYCGTKHAIGVSSGTDALLCSLMGLGIEPGDEVITVPFTFFATAGAIARLHARPVFVDIDADTFNLNPGLLERAITPRTRAIIPVHLFGQLADMEAICRVAARHGLRVVEDAAQAIGARHNGRQACTFGTCGCLSFYPTKNLGGFGDGGAICTNDDALAATCRLLRTHGAPPDNPYDHRIVGGMFRLDALQAAILQAKLRHLENWHEARRRNAALYDQLLAHERIRTPYIAPGNYSVYNQYVIRVPDRDVVRRKLTAAGIGTAVYYPTPLHLQPCFAYLGYSLGDFPEAERACREVLALPVYPELTEQQIRHVAQAVLDAVQTSRGSGHTQAS